ncbi:zinc-ribbon domain-containing protein [Sutcliffiella horikoshii]|uniref:Zinc-ribbon domain-containing protein n=1 Tax=Sutcliffiella horikoshii TaxID=79883 RepID=A0A5D4SW17_9BACI|nr:FxLYD domain-containing protein [Sutcliffiella horikoshii]TYS67570.1 zinc-ribbon domain-containing protein [Sutcliffiella horikoshii]
MFCHKCGRKVTSDANFCFNCGANLKDEVEQNEEQWLEGRGKNKKKRFTYMPFLPPIISLVLIAGTIGWYYNHEQSVNAEVLAIKKEAEDLAVQGEYDKAKEELAGAMALRPSYHVLRNNLEVVKIAEEVNGELEEVKEQIKTKKFEDAEKNLTRLREKITRLDGPLIQPLKEDVSEKDVMIKVGKINNELDQLKTVDDLSRKLAVISSIPSEEGKAVKEQILNRIVQITVEDAEEKIEQKQFTNAMTLADRGLQYAVNDKRLLSLKEKIEQSRQEFEQAEFDRIEKAMEAAAKEDLKNKNAALEIVNFKAEEDEVGGMTVTGEVKNIVSATVSSITVYYNILSKDKTVLDTGFTTVYPFKLEPGKKGKFEDYYYGVFEDVTVEIENITWVVEE